MRYFSKILVALDIVDGAVSDSGRAAVAASGALARAHGASLTLVHVLHGAGPTRGDTASAPGSLAAQTSALLESVAPLAGAVDVRTEVRFGTDWRELVLTVANEAYDLVVLGTKHRGVAGRMLFGSTGSKLLRTCPCPVWIVKANDVPASPRILVAHDLADAGHVALEVGASMAAAQSGDLHLLHVVEHPEASRFLGSISAEERARRLAAAEEQLRVDAQRADGDINVITCVRDGNAHAEILDYVGKHDITTLVMGTVARSGLAGLLTGNTAENVLPWVNCSLVAVKPPGFESPALPRNTK
jgi:universal stress protein E